jgi:23S rRNA G2445 N2-methylase RlmL
MNTSNFKIKLTFIEGLKDFVVNEVKKSTSFNGIDIKAQEICVNFNDKYDDLLELRSVSQVSIVSESPKFNPTYISKNKSIVGNIINEVLKNKSEVFKTFKISCAGSDSPEVKSIVKYVESEYKLEQSLEADLKIAIAKTGATWEVSVQATRRPLSVRDYKASNMSGAMDPTIAYALNSLCDAENKKSYLNIFSGSATLLIEAGLISKNIDTLVGFDNNKNHLSIAYQNITKAGLIKKIKLYEKDIYDFPDIGIFEVIAADLPFGMKISKDEDLARLYKAFVDYSDQTLIRGGVLGVYTSEVDLFERAIDESNFKVVNRLKLTLVTNVGSYLYPEVFICKRR